VLISGCSAAYWGGLSEDPKFQVQGQTAIGLDFLFFRAPKDAAG